MSQPNRDTPPTLTTGILPNDTLSESPVSTPVLRPEADSVLDGDLPVPALRLDDIRSAVSLNDASEDNDSVSATIAFPQDSSFPQVTITTSNDHLMVPSTPIINTPPLYTNDTTIPSIIPTPSTGHVDPSPSTASSAFSEGDRLTELPVSFSAARLQNLARKAAEVASMPTQSDSISFSLKANASRRSLQSESEQASVAGTISGKARGDSTPKRVSFEGERPSFSSSVRNGKLLNGISRLQPFCSRASAVGFLPASPPLEGRASEGPRSPQNQKSHSSPGRTPSPLRNFWPLHRSHSREEPFVPVDPYRLNVVLVQITLHHILSQVIRQIYRHLLLRVPSIYFTRVSRVFEIAEVSRPEVQRMIESRNKGDSFRWPADHEWVAPNVSPALIRFKESWETFVESILKEWKTLNVVSALLLTCVVLLPIYGRAKPEIEGASTAPVIRTTAFLSLFCALMSLVYGCTYILRFGTMKSMYRASRWAEEAQHTSIFWNVWILLAMPAVWISYSMIFFCVCILDFVWDQPFTSPSSLRDFTQAEGNSEVRTTSLAAADRIALAPRIIISLVFVLGLVYFILVIRTFRSWSDPRVSEDVRESMETGRWTPRTPSPAPASPRPSRASRFNAGKAMELAEEEKSAMKRVQKERRTRSVDSVMV